MMMRDGPLSIEYVVRWHGKRITVDDESPLAKRWPLGTVVSCQWGSRAFRRRGFVLGWTRTKVVVAMPDYPYTYHGMPHLLRKDRRSPRVSEGGEPT